MAKQYSAPPPMTIDPNKQYTGTMETSEGTITFELYPKEAPLHVNSFVFLSRDGYYDGVIFHRVIPDFMIQGGDPTGTGSGGPGYKVKAEFNNIHHAPGVLSAARTNDPNSAGSQFFIMHGDSPHLDHQYSAFGKVTSGMDVVDRIAKAKKGANDRPVNPAKINKITIQEK
jgi:peptidyl-prolyl cis-trans isomerase B (cyclophilin B)